MDPLQVEAQLRNTFLTLLGGDMSIYEGQKQQMQQRFNNESRQIAINMISQAQQACRAITMTDYQNVSLQLINTYKSSMPAQQMYAGGQPQVVQPMYAQPPMGQPMYAQQPAVQPMYMQQQPMYTPQPQVYMQPQQRFNGNLRYTPSGVMPLYAQQQQQYQPLPQTIGVTNPNQNLYSGALPAGSQAPQPIQAQPQYLPPMSTVSKTTTPITIQEEAPVIQPNYSAYSMPPMVKCKMFQSKAPYAIKGNVYTYQKNDGSNIFTVVGTVSSPVSDIATIAKTIAKKEKAHDVTLTYTPYELIAGDLADMQTSFIAVKKIINDGLAANVAPSSVVASIVNLCDTKTKGVAKRIEKIIMDAYSAYVMIANNNDDGVVIPEADELECLQTSGSATMELSIGKALREFEQCSIYDPASSQMSAFLKEIELDVPETYAELKKNKAKFTEWAKSHCILKKPNEVYRITAVDHGANDITQMFGYRSDTPPDDELEFFTIEGVKQSNARKITMVVQEGKSFTTANGSIDRNDGVIRVEFQ